jgi:AraC family transcriptional regulator of adaptative response/methylated-DNA-[protein]-cysteine methyltransferase
MDPQKHLNYKRIAEAIDFILENFKDQPTLEQVAERLHLSPFHFQRLFSEWAGTSPKKFLQFISVQHAKKLLKENKSSLFDTAFDTGLSGTSRLHDLFIKIEGMTPAEYKYGGNNLHINYSYADSPFGSLLVASTHRGICFMAFSEDGDRAFLSLKSDFPLATFQKQRDAIQQNALVIFEEDWSNIKQIKLHLKGTSFQLKVWEALLQIPLGQLTTYGNIAAQIDKPSASRAVGTAIGSNPVAFLIPCHRVIQRTGIFGGYMWGKTRKLAIIGWEGARKHSTLKSTTYGSF